MAAPLRVEKVKMRMVTNRRHSCRQWSLGNKAMSNVGSSVVTNVHSGGVLVTGEAVLVWGQEANGKSLYLPLNSAVTLKVLLKNCLRKCKQKIHGNSHCGTVG